MCEDVNEQVKKDNCTEEDEAKNQKYDETLSPEFACHDFTVTNVKNPLTFTGNSGETTWESSSFIHCVN